MAIEFRLDIEKTVEAVATLLKLHGDTGMSSTRLLKLLYMADRTALNEIEWPITGDRAVSTRYGPVPASIRDLLNSSSSDVFTSHNDFDATLKYWSTYIKTDSEKVSLLKDPGLQKLCEAEGEILEKVYQEYRTVDPLDTAQWTHATPEWESPESSGMQNQLIPVETILQSIGMDEEEIEYIQQIAERENYFDDVLHRKQPGKKVLEEAA